MTTSNGQPDGDPETPPNGTPWQQHLLTLLIIAPILLYLASAFTSREEELKRYHRQMVALEEAMTESLDDGSEVLKAGIAGKMPARQRVPILDPQEDRTCEKLQPEHSSALAQIKSGPYANMSLKPYLPCTVDWKAEAGNLELYLELDRPMKTTVSQESYEGPPKVAEPKKTNVSPESYEGPPKEDEPSKGNGSEPEFFFRADYRLRYSGNINLVERLRELAKTSDFDALVIANAKGELIMRLGPAAPLFSSLPVLISPIWDQALERKPKSREKSENLFVPQGIEQIEREVAGINYTLFPREIVLRPDALVEDPLSCRSGSAGGETLRLRAIGLVESSRLTLKSLRPSEGAYWFFCWAYAAASLLVLEQVFIRKRKLLFRVLAKATVFVVASAVGFMLALTVVSWGVQNWRDVRLEKLANLAVSQIPLDLKGAHSASEKGNTLDRVERFWIFQTADTQLSQKFGMVRSEDGCRNKLRRFDAGLDEFLSQVEKADGGPAFRVHSAVSRADGFRSTLVATPNIVLAPPETIDSAAASENIKTPAIEVAAIHLDSFNSRSYPSAFGAALVDIDRKEGVWHLLQDSEEKKHTGKDFLEDFSDPTCLELRFAEALRNGVHGEHGGFCSGTLRGQQARLRVTALSSVPANGQESTYDFEEWKREGALGLVTYSYFKPHELTVEAAVLASCRALPVFALAFVLLAGIIFLLAVVVIFARMRLAEKYASELVSPSFAEIWRSTFGSCKTYLDRHQREAICGVAITLSLLAFCWAWSLESDLYFSLSDPPPSSGAPLTSGLYEYFRPESARQAILSTVLLSAPHASSESRLAFWPKDWGWPNLTLLAGLAVCAFFLFLLWRKEGNFRLDLDLKGSPWLKALLFLWPLIVLLILAYGQELVSSVVTALGSLALLKSDLLKIANAGQQRPGDNNN